MSVTAPLISVVDDDESIRESLPDLIRTFGFTAEAFSSAEDFLASPELEATSCLVLDISMPGMSGPELQQELKGQGREIPIVFITAHIDEADCPRLIERGATACLAKPFNESDLLRAITDALVASG